MAEISSLSVTDASNTARWPEGMAFSSVNDSGRADEGILARFYKDVFGGLTTTGSSNAYAVSLNRGDFDLTAAYDGYIIGVILNHASTGAATLNVTPSGGSAKGAVPIRKNHDVAIASGDFEAGMFVFFQYEYVDGTTTNDRFQLLTPVANAPLGSALTRGSAFAGDSSGVAAAVDISSDGNALVGDGTDAVATGIIKQGTHTIWVPAGAMRPTVSNGCASITDVETTAGRPDIQVLDFDATADEHAQFSVSFPKSWDEGTITFQVFWTSTATDTDGVTWALQGVSVSDGDTIDVAYGTAVTVDDANQSTAEDLYVTSVSGAVTVAGTPAAGDLCYFRIFRDVSDANDTATEDARLIGVKLFYTVNAADDS